MTMSRPYTIKKNCLCCGREVEVKMTERDYDGYTRRFIFGEPIPIQQAMPDVTPAKREIFLSGACSDCFDFMFNWEEE